MADFSILNTDAALALLREKLNDDLLQAAEPVVRRALVEIEQEMRAALATRLVSFIEQSFELHRERNRLVISVRQEDARHG